MKNNKGLTVLLVKKKCIINEFVLTIFSEFIESVVCQFF